MHANLLSPPRKGPDLEEVRGWGRGVVYFIRLLTSLLKEEAENSRSHRQRLGV